LPTNLLWGLHAKLLHWFRDLIRSDYPPEERQHHWLNSVGHFKGNHEGCRREHLEGHATVKILTLEAEDQLIHVLQETVELVIRTRHDLDTQLCESFNSVKAKFAEKDISWRISWPIRVMCAILHMNSETNWRTSLATICGIELSPDIVHRLDQHYLQERVRNRERGSPAAPLKDCRR
jgi:hypothetical protein